MRNLLRSPLLYLLGCVIAVFAATAAIAQQQVRPKPTVIFVHGAWADGSGWEPVATEVSKRGFRVVVVQNPLASLASDVEATRRAIVNHPGPVVLVGHSWGGVVITEAGLHDQVTGLVYVAAFGLDAGESVSSLLSGKDSPKPPGLASIRADATGHLWLTMEGVAQDFAQDLPASKTWFMGVSQVPIYGKAFDETVTNVAWKSKPSWYVVATADRMIPPAAQELFARRMGATTARVPSSHVPMLSRPADVAAVVIAAAENAAGR
jgi:pimeloyl-ACP methyl ester carboxylesterase